MERRVTTPPITITTLGAVELATDLETWGRQFGDRAVSVTRHYAALIKADVIARARTAFEVSDYNIHYVTTIGKGWVRADIGTDEPQGYRLEFGFVGTDSKGRVYHQRPRPHFGPALDQFASAYEQAIAALAVP